MVHNLVLVRTAGDLKSIRKHFQFFGKFNAQNGCIAFRIIFHYLVSVWDYLVAYM